MKAAYWFGGIALVLLPGAGAAQIPQTFENLQVLPKDISRADLIIQMRDMASGLGVRCVHCHTGEDTPNLDKIDFKSDDKIEKRQARYMMRMVQQINNEGLAALPERSNPAVRVSCITCHRRSATPHTITDALTEAINTGGAAAGAAKFRELRNATFGDGRYDLRPDLVLTFTQNDYLSQRKFDVSLELAKAVIEFHPNHPQGHFIIGESHHGLGQRDAAIAAFRKVIELQPNHQRAQARLRELGAA